MGGSRTAGGRGSIVTGLAAAVLLVPAAAPGQSAWLPLDGESSVSFTFQTLEFGGHFDEHGRKLDGAVPSRSLVGIVQFEHGITDKLAFTARLPFIASRFTGDQDEPVTAFLNERYEEFRHTHPHLEATSLDTGAYYATFQDLGFTLRYNLVEGIAAVTPLIGVTIPSHDYRTVGEAAPGQNRRALLLGVNVGALLYPMLPRAYVHGRYTYSFVQPLAGVSLDRSNAEFEFGYSLKPRLSVRALANWLHTHGGVPFSVAYEDVEFYLVHDRLLASSYWHLGAGATFAITDSLELDGAFVGFLAGTDTHYGLGTTIGLTWRFYAGGAAPSRQRLRGP